MRVKERLNDPPKTMHVYRYNICVQVHFIRMVYVLFRVRVNEPPALMYINLWLYIYVYSMAKLHLNLAAFFFFNLFTLRSLQKTFRPNTMQVISLSRRPRNFFFKYTSLSVSLSYSLDCLSLFFSFSCCHFTYVQERN